MPASCQVSWNVLFNGTAYLSVAGINTCGIGEFSEVLNITASPLIGIRDLAIYDDLFVWPNPGNGILNIKSSLTGHSRLSVSNSQGKSIWQSAYSLLPEIISLNLGKVSPGIYILVIENEKSRQIKRIVIE